MTTGEPAPKNYEESGWTCASCLSPVKYKRMKLATGMGNRFRVISIEKSCTCEDDKIMNRAKGLILSPEKW